MIFSLALQAAEAEDSDNIQAIELFIIARESYVPSVGNLLYGWGMLQGLGKAWSGHDMIGNESSGAMGGIALDNASHMCYNAYHSRWGLTKTSVQEDQIYDLAFFGGVEYNPSAIVLLEYKLPLPFDIYWCTFVQCQTPSTPFVLVSL